ncbi:hypothetical protein ACP70R_035558 [Stipagrostis hirtigluma subsp. patula]
MSKVSGDGVREDAEGSVGARWREQKHLLRTAVDARYTMAEAHTGHAAALRSISVVLSDYAAGERAAHLDASVASITGVRAAARAFPPSPPFDAVLTPPLPSSAGEGNRPCSSGPKPCGKLESLCNCACGRNRFQTIHTVEPAQPTQSNISLQLVQTTPTQ